MEGPCLFAGEMVAFHKSCRVGWHLGEFIEILVGTARGRIITVGHKDAWYTHFRSGITGEVFGMMSVPWRKGSLSHRSSASGGQFLCETKSVPRHREKGLRTREKWLGS